MLEDLAMEKKLGCPGQSPKGIAEINRTQDVTVARTHSRSPRKREKEVHHDEQFKKQSCYTSKSKQFSRKSSARSSHHEIGGKVAELAGLDEDYDLKRSKKQNLTHLLNIRCKPRESYLYSSHGSTSRAVVPHKSIRYLMTTQKHKYNKEQFLQANCQFVVRDDADYSVHMTEPDILVDWNLIEQIRVPSFEPGTCPICLEELIAGKITRCGHIYCWPCILHYLSLTLQTWYKCPICYEAIHQKDLKRYDCRICKSVQIVIQTCFNKNEEITFQLMKREKGSTISVPVREPCRIKNVLLSVSEINYTTVYSKLLLINRENISKLIQIEENQLLNQLKETEGTLDERYVRYAMELLKNRKVELLARDGGIEMDDTGHQGMSDICCAAEMIPTAASTHVFSEPILEVGGNVALQPANVELVFETIEGSSKNADAKQPNSDESWSEALNSTESSPNNVSSSDYQQKSRIRNESASSDEVPSFITFEDLEIDTVNVIPSKYYFFYQANDGQQIYLHSLNVRMLEKQFGSLEHSPPILKGNIVEIEMGSMTEELRKRLRYLDHLPVTCQFQVVEIDLRESVSNSTRMFFNDQLEKRARLRQKKAKEERKLEKRAEMMVRKQYGCDTRLSPVRLHLDSLDHFPQCGAEEPTKLSQKNKTPRSSCSNSPVSSGRSISPVTSAVDTLTLNHNTFAQKLKETNKSGGWQKRTRANSESDGAICSPNVLSDAVEAALRQARLEKEGGGQNVGKNKKKKKPRPIPLCSLGMVYNNS